MMTLIGFKIYTIVSRYMAECTSELTEELKADELAHLGSASKTSIPHVERTT
jgi:hypothetical protein